MKVKEESEKAGLKLNIQKTKITAPSPITSQQIDGETMECLPDPGIEPRSPALQADSLPSELPEKCFQNNYSLFLCMCYLKVHKEELSHVNYLRFSL